MSIYFISNNEDWVLYMRELFKNTHHHVEAADIRSMPTDRTCFVSPANSLGFMDGGIDLILSRDIFPGIEKKVKDRIRTLNIISAAGRPYLPIGSVIAVPYNSAHLIVTPTMFLPHDVQGTQNAYWSFLAALNMWNVLKSRGIANNMVVTSHCCGVGKMPAKESADQMFRAYTDFTNMNCPGPITISDDCIIYPNHDMEQPNNMITVK